MASGPSGRDEAFIARRREVHPRARWTWRETGLFEAEDDGALWLRATSPDEPDADVASEADGSEERPGCELPVTD